MMSERQELNGGSLDVCLKTTFTAAEFTVQRCRALEFRNSQIQSREYRLHFLNFFE
jgi:hypothetical protein